MKLYRTIIADPPWPHTGHLGPSKAHRPNSYAAPLAGVNSVKRYGKMSVAEICSLRPPVEPDAHLYLWATNAFLADGSAARVVSAWGFRPITVVTWCKVKPDGRTASMKVGMYFRGATEHFVFAVRGSLPAEGLPEPTFFCSPRLPHSVKPEWFYSLVERKSPGPYLEMFARPVSPLFPKMPGWHTWGNEMENDVVVAGT